MYAGALARAAQVIRQGGLVAYPTESCYGIGCDPKNYHAVKRLLKLKQRPANKGLILIASSTKQLQPYVLEISDHVLQTWPGPHTWLIPAKKNIPFWVKGNHANVAVRITAHAIANKLCQATGHAIVSTSANYSGCRPVKTYREAENLFGRELNFILPGRIGKQRNPSSIVDASTQQVVRAG